MHDFPIPAGAEDPAEGAIADNEPASGGSGPIPEPDAMKTDGWSFAGHGGPSQA